ncbi:radical SAM protein [Sulfurimonas sp. SAG-AH-194-I05]|nr:SPASM domain-containing protein [Sulfurimonas sp. SAG-AH-194-I05]MDF1875750.1 radical SAM protein [Sulfurimonas sp. SAG-AH-194-I05]
MIDKNEPISISLEINNICNADCTFCGYGKDGADPREKGKLYKSVFEKTLNLMSNSKVNILDITPTLGEVGVDNRWLELVKEAKASEGVSIVRSYTNAINLHKFGFDKILNSGLDVLQLSSSLIDREMYKRLYGVDKYNQVIENILGICKRNYELGFPVDISLNLRVDLPINNFYKTEFYEEIRQYILNKKITFLENYDDFNGLIGSNDLPINAKFASNQFLKNNDNLPCYQLYRAMQINYDGVIQGCACRVEPELWTDNILDHKSIKSAWKNDKLENIRYQWMAENSIPECCKTCMHYYPYTNLLEDSTKSVIKRYVLSMMKKLDIYKYYIYLNLWKQKSRNTNV